MKNTRQGKGWQQQGSMLVLALMALLIVTAIGLSLTFVTEMEMQLGATDKVLATTFYAAESGLHAAVAGIPHQNWAGEQIVRVEGRIGPDTLIGTRVVTSRVHAVGSPQLPPMSMANEGEIDYHSFSVALRAVAQRVSWPDTEPAPVYGEGDPAELDVTIQAERAVAVELFVSPIRTPATGEEIYNNAAPLAF